MIKKEYYVDTEITFQTKLYLGWTYLTTKEFFKQNRPKENDELIVVTTHYPDYKYIYAYGNSRGDYEMLDIANESHYKPFT